MYIPSSFCNFTAPVLVMCMIKYGPSQCVFNFSGCLKNLLSYRKTSPSTLNGLILIWWSCHAFCLYFSMFWWNPTTKRSSSIWTSYDSIFSTASASVISVSTAILKLGIIYSISTTTSCPYTNLNGVCPVSRLQVVQYAHSTSETFWS